MEDNLEAITRIVPVTTRHGRGIGIYGLVILAGLAGLPTSGCISVPTGPVKEGMESMAEHFKDIIGFTKLYDDNINLIVTSSHHPSICPSSL